jgi:hypothetical protein
VVLLLFIVAHGSDVIYRGTAVEANSNAQPTYMHTL